MKYSIPYLGQSLAVKYLKAEKSTFKLVHKKKKC